MEEGSLFQRMKQIFHEDEMDEEMQKEAAGLIRNIFRYMDKDAKDIMTHRKNIVAIDGDWSLEEALQFMLDERFSRFPVYQEDIDEIIGIIHLRDATSGYLDKSKRQCPVKNLEEYLRPVTYIPETKSIDTLFKEMQAAKNHMVVVLDEYGQTSGLVAMEDILEEIVGNILDEYDEEDEMIKKQNDGSMIVNGLTELEDLEDLIPVTFDKEDAKCMLKGEKVYPCYFPTNRNLKNLIKNTFVAWKVLRKEKPDLVRSSGAAVAVPFFYLAKLMGSKLIYIEVFDRIDKSTLTGKLVYPIADKFIVQWDEMKKVYPKAINLGSIF